MGNGDTNSKAVSVVYDTSTFTGGQLSSTNNNPISLNSHIGQAKVYSYQILSDGNTLINYTVQVTNIPNVFSAYTKIFGNVSTRDDSLTSQMWSTVETGQLPKNTGVVQGTIRLYANNAHVHSRILFNWDASNTGGTTSNVWACVRVMGI